MPKYNVQGVVLKNTNYSDADKIYTIITKDRGKISALAKGVRKISSRRSGNLDTLNHVSLSLVESASGHKTIIEAKLLDSFPKLKSSLKNLKQSFYILELMHRFLQEDNDTYEVYRLLLSTLNRLERSVSELDAQVVLNAFEIRLVALLGYELTLNSCIKCHRSFSAEWVSCKFNLSQGGLVCSNCNVFGVSVPLGAAAVLSSLDSHKKGVPSNVRSSSEDIFIADDLIKIYIRELLEDSFKTARVFNSI